MLHKMCMQLLNLAVNATLDRKRKNSTPRAQHTSQPDSGLGCFSQHKSPHIQSLFCCDQSLPLLPTLTASPAHRGLLSPRAGPCGLALASAGSRPALQGAASAAGRHGVWPPPTGLRHQGPQTNAGDSHRVAHRAAGERRQRRFRVWRLPQHRGGLRPWTRAWPGHLWRGAAGDVCWLGNLHTVPERA